MRIILSDFMSLDGVVQAPGGQGEDDDGGFAHGGWSVPFFDLDVMGEAIDQVMAHTDAMVFGRRTWENMAAAWPARAGDPFADRINAIPKHVASRTLSAEEVASRWTNSRLIEGDAMAAVRELRAQEGDGGIQVWGCASLALQLAEQDLVDELRLFVEPILLGGGKGIFPRDGRARPLELVSVTPARTGTLVCTYRPAPA
jgi:dihydrofolate reductase